MFKYTLIVLVIIFVFHGYFNGIIRDFVYVGAEKQAGLGGEEFMILLPNTDLVAAYETADRYRKAVEADPLPIAGKIPQVSALRRRRI